MDEMDDCFSAFFSYFCRKSKKVAHAFVCFHILFKFAVLERKCSCTSPGRHTLEVFSYSAPVNLGNSSLCNKNTRTPPEDLSHVLTLLAHFLVWATFLILCTGSREPSGGIR